MKFKANTKELSELLSNVLPAISMRNTLPALSHFLVEAKDNTLSVYGTDLEIGIKSSIETKVEEEGEITMPAKKLTDIINVIDTQEISISKVTETECEITAADDSTRFKIMAGDTEEFPILPNLNEDISIEIQVSQLKEGIEKTIFSVSKDESRYVLCGILFESDGENFNMISTDGRRLSMFKSKLGREERKFKAIVPTKATSILERALQKNGDKVKININYKENQIYFTFGRTIIYSRLIEGDYPNYNQVIPDKSNKTIRIATEDMHKATRQMTAVTTRTSLAVKYNFAKDKAVVSVNSPEVGSGICTVPAKNSGDEIEISFNPDFILNILKVIQSEAVDLKLTTSINPGKIIPVSEEESYIGVVMPMRL
ncbi:MAG: DNA polymerase III subunit beta [Elusimicrobiota bacterium]